MPSRRDQVQMTDAEVDAFLDGQQVLNVATIGRDGQPHLVAMWYVMIDGRPAFWTFAKSQKALNLRRDPRLTALVESGDTYAELRGVELVGTARLIEDYDSIHDVGRRVAAKYQGASSLDGPGGEMIAAQAHKRIGIAIDVTRVASWDHRKLAGSY